MGNHSTKSQNVNRDHRPKKNVHWKSAGNVQFVHSLPSVTDNRQSVFIHSANETCKSIGIDSSLVNYQNELELLNELTEMSMNFRLTISRSRCRSLSLYIPTIIRTVVFV